MYAKLMMVIFVTVVTGQQTVWPRTEDRFLCSPVVHVHNYLDKQEQGDQPEASQVDQLRDHLTRLQARIDSIQTNGTKQVQSRDILIAELQEQVKNLTTELSLLKQACRETCPETDEGLTCPSGYVQFQDSCFKFSTDRKTYSQARSTCQADGGHLSLVKDEATNTFLLSQMETIYASFNTPHIYVGATDQVQEGTYVWDDGTPVTGWAGWAPGQPADVPPAMTSDCAEWRLGSRGNGWVMDQCYFSQYYVCEVSATAA
ncbi:CD209 [Branchiostoma lanceolatum]|uniref:CD209 protein n=1 Tax=Branchiostoma lanceolatum TaxID=7740 RepID=A0A8J9YS89_BRALA|nr:CD209 [Branchiostoma lanceolatum]